MFKSYYIKLIKERNRLEQTILPFRCDKGTSTTNSKPNKQTEVTNSKPNQQMLVIRLS